MHMYDYVINQNHYDKSLFSYYVEENRRSVCVQSGYFTDSHYDDPINADYSGVRYFNKPVVDMITDEKNSYIIYNYNEHFDMCVEEY